MIRWCREFWDSLVLEDKIGFPAVLFIVLGLLTLGVCIGEGWGWCKCR